MSKAFTKEETDIPERSGRVRSPSGLPPGALNYITAHGMARLRSDLADLQSGKDGNADGVQREARELELSISSATVVEPPDAIPDTVIFGSTVTVQTESAEMVKIQIVGSDEVGFTENSVSWISPMGKALLGKELGNAVSLGGKEDQKFGVITAIGYLSKFDAHSAA